MSAALTAAALLASSGAVAAVAPEPSLPTAERSIAAPARAAERALARAQALAAGPASLRTAGSTTSDPHGATLVLRELAASLRYLSGDDLAAARAILARPSENPDPDVDGLVSWGGGPELSTCSATLPLCVHWTTARPHRPSLTDDDANGVPDWVDSMLAETEHVWDAQVTTLGYKAPVPDGASPVNGGGPQLDIYVANVGSLGYYGYCTSDDPDLDLPSTPARSAVSAYCVLDDDYSARDFPVNTPLQNLRVTAAHEFFHAVQFGYDFYEDRWLMESTAAWIEDVVFDSVDDNRQYLRTSALKAPVISLDRGTSGFQYGSWIFFRFLSERYGDGIVRGIWQRADDSPDQVSTNDLKTYSLPAINATLAKRGTSLRKMFGSFAAANTTPKRFYDEGARYPSARPPQRKLSRANPATPWLYTDLDHLSSLPLLLKRGPGVGNKAKVRIAIDAPGAAAQPEARVVVRYASGNAKIVNLRLNRRGNGAVTVAFGSRKVAGVLAVLTNASSRYRSCWQQAFGDLSCWSGTPVDDGLRFRVKAALR